MTISFHFKVEGEHYPVTRIITPSHSLNVALAGENGDEGIPNRNLIEISGDTGIGKSTCATNIASWVSQKSGNLPIAYLDLEGQDENTIMNTLVNSGYNADTFNWVSPTGKSKASKGDEALLGQLEDALNEEPPYIGILDSVAAISPVAEVEGDLGDANMGRRSFTMAQFTRRITRTLRMSEIPTCLFMLNHQYTKIGAIGRAKVYESPGGMVKNNLEKLRLQMRIPWVDYISTGDGKAEARWDGGWVLEGKVDKNRSGAKSDVFQVFIYGGWGIHVGMSAVIDCLASGLAEVKSGGKLSMAGQDYGLLSKVIANKRDDSEFFIPFINELKVEKFVTVSSEEGE